MNTALNFQTLIDNRIKELFDQYLAMMPHSIPCKVVEYKNETVKVVPTVTDTVQVTPIEEVPVMKSIYNNLPIKADDIGILITCDYDYSNSIKNSDLTWNKIKNRDGGGYIFIPLAQQMKNFVKDEKANVLYSQDGTRSISIEDKQIIIQDENNIITIDDEQIDILDGNNNNDILLSSEGITIKDANDNKIIASSEGIAIEDANGNKIATSSSGIEIKDANGNKITTSSTGIVSATSGGTKIEMTSVQVAINGTALTVLA